MNMDTGRPATLGDWLGLREQMSAAELLLEDEQIDPANLPEYWAISAELLAMIEATDERLEDWREHGPGAYAPSTMQYYIAFSMHAPRAERRSTKFS